MKHAWSGGKQSAWRLRFHSSLAKTSEEMVRYPITAMGTACVSVYRTFCFGDWCSPRKPRDSRLVPVGSHGLVAQELRRRRHALVAAQAVHFSGSSAHAKLPISDRCKARCRVYTIQSRLERCRRLKNGCKPGRLWRLRGGLWRDSKARSSGAASSGRLRESEFFQQGVAAAGETWMSQSRSSLASLAPAPDRTLYPKTNLRRSGFLLQWHGSRYAIFYQTLVATHGHGVRADFLHLFS